MLLCVIMTSDSVYVCVYLLRIRVQEQMRIVKENQASEIV